MIARERTRQNERRRMEREEEMGAMGEAEKVEEVGVRKIVE